MVRGQLPPPQPPGPPTQTHNRGSGALPATRLLLGNLVVEAVAWRHAEPDDLCPATHTAQPPSDVRICRCGSGIPAWLRSVLAASGLVAEGEDRCLDAVLQAEFGEDAADVS